MKPQIMQLIYEVLNFVQVQFDLESIIISQDKNKWFMSLNSNNNLLEFIKFYCQLMYSIV